LPFHGTYEHSLDAKNRLTVPARFRAQLADGLTIVKGFETCLQVYPSAEYDRIAQQALAGVNPLSPQARELKRHLFGNAMPAELDSAGRIQLPGPFLEHASISKDCVVWGAGDCLELWDKAHWKDYDSGLISRAADHIESIGHPA
jgi:MraZ protein